MVAKYCQRIRLIKFFKVNEVIKTLVSSGYVSDYREHAKIIFESYEWYVHMTLYSTCFIS